MKKVVLTAAVILGFTMGSYAQGLYQDNEVMGGGLFGRGPIYEGMTRDGGTFSLCLPGHNFITNWNGGLQGHDDELLPLGNGALLLIGFGAAYALSKRKKKD
jgi:hypothetical protein